jgi:hypothetical protein
MDFTTHICNLEHINPYTNKKCEICGEDFSEFITMDIDPYVTTRREAMKPIKQIIELKKSERKTWFSKFRNGEVQKEVTYEPFEKIQSIISRLDYEVNKNIFDDIDLNHDNIENPMVQISIKKMAELISKLYDLLSETEKSEFTMIWKNINNRLTTSIRLYLEGYTNFLESAVALDYPAAYKLQDEAQKKLDSACYEISILGKIVENQSISIDYELIKDGKINTSAIIAMIVNSSENSFNETIEKTNELTFYYFSDFMNKSYKELDKSKLLHLSAYRYVGTTICDDSDFLSKAKIVLDLLNKSYKKDTTRFHNFFRLYLDKYIYMQNKLNEFSVNSSYIIGSNPPNDLLMNYSIKWYKDLSEGIYREAARIVYYSYKIIQDKEFDDEDILSWLGFTDIVGEFEQLKKLHLDRLTEGIDKIIRHSEAHVDYDIDIQSEEIVLRNVNPHNRTKNEKKYSFVEFFQITNKLAETVFSILCGIQLFLCNNSDTFVDEINYIDEHDKDVSSNIPTATILFAMNGIIIDDGKSIIEDKNIYLTGCLIDDIDLKKLGDKILISCAEISRKITDIDIIHITLINNDSNTLGNIKIHTKYFKKYFSDESSFKDYYLLLAKLTSKIDDVFIDGLINNNDLICAKSIFTLLFGPINKVIDAFRDKDLVFNTRIKEEINEAIIETKLIKHIVELYEEYSSDRRITMHLIMVINQILISLNNMGKYGLLTSDFKYYCDSIVMVTDLVHEQIKVITGELSLDLYLRNYLRNPFSYTKDIQVNDRCPCGSGKKYKQCCKK